MLEIQNLNFSYENKMIFHNLCLQLARGKLYCLIGNNGIGKTTFFRLVSGHIQQDEGTIVGNERSDDILFIPSSYQMTEFLTEEEFYTLVLSTYKMEMTVPKKKFVSSDKKRLGEYSEGMKKMVILNIIQQLPQNIILLDELLSNLDMLNKQKYLQELAEFAKVHAKLIVLTTQEVGIAYELKENLCVFHDKKIIQRERAEKNYEDFQTDILAILQQNIGVDA